MGNRAVITTEDEKFGIYVHWNGGRDSVDAFLKYCDLQGFRSPTADLTYGFARLAQVICNFFGGGLSCGVGPLEKLDCDNYDNGMYIIKHWEIIGRKYFTGEEQNEYELFGMLLEIDKNQPQRMQLGEEKIKQMCEERGWTGPKFKIGEKVYAKSPINDEKIPGTIKDSWEVEGKKGYTVELENDKTQWFYSETQVEKR